jgi:clan AA aspartic protease
VNGIVDQFGRALVTLRIQPNAGAESTEIDAWIDTGFNGELVIPRSTIELAGLEQSAGIEAKLADGKTVMMEAFTCLLHWFGEVRAVEVIASDGELPLLGIGLLLGHRLIVDYGRLTVAIETCYEGAIQTKRSPTHSLSNWRRSEIKSGRAFATRNVVASFVAPLQGSGFSWGLVTQGVARGFRRVALPLG